MSALGKIMEGVAGPTPIGVAKPHVFRDNWQTLIELGWSPVGIYPANEKNKAKAKLPIGYGWQQRSEVVIGMDDLPLLDAKGEALLDNRGRQKMALGVAGILKYRPPALSGVSGCETD